MDIKQTLVEIIKTATIDKTLFNSDDEPIYTYKVRVVDEEIVDAFVDYLISKEIIVLQHATRGLHLGHKHYCSNCGRLAYCENYCSICGAKIGG